MMRCKIKYCFKSIILTGVFLSIITPLWAGKPPLSLSLHDAILLSLRFSPVVKGAEIQRVVDKFNLSVAQNQFEFQYALTGLANQTNTVTNGDPLLIRGLYNATPSISRQTVYGTQYNMFMSNPVTVTKFQGLQTAYYNPAVTLQMVQPIIQGSGREIVESNLVQAINTEKTTEFTYKAIVMNKITQVIVDYWNVVFAEGSLFVAQDALKAAQKTVKENRARIKLGFMAPSENIQALSFVASQEVQVASAEYSLLLAKYTLLRDIGLSPSTPITVHKSIPVEKITYPKGEEAKRLMFENNPAYLVALNSLKNSKIALLQAEDRQRWSLNLVGTVVQGAGVGGNGNDGISSLYNGRNRERSLGLQLNVPIDNLPLQQQLVAAKVAYTQQQLAVQDLRIILEANLLSSLDNLRILLIQVKLAKEAERLANQSYLDALKKLQFGQSSMFEVTTLQSTYISDRLITINTEISYLNAMAQYQNLLGITLDVQEINLTY